MKKPLFPRFLSSNRPRDKLVTYYLYCYDLRQQALDRLVGRVSFASGESMEFTDPQDYLRAIREELPTKNVTGFRFETLTDDPAVRKAVDDMAYDLYGEENPRPLEDYGPRQGPSLGGIT